MDTNIVIVLVVSVIAIIAAVLITAKVTTTRLKKNAEGNHRQRRGEGKRDY